MAVDDAGVLRGRGVPLVDHGTGHGAGKFLFILVRAIRMTSLVFCAQVSWLLLGIDDLGMQLEQPYTVMALKQFCEDVQVST